MNNLALRRSFRTLFTVATLLLIATVRAHAQNGCVVDGSQNCTPEIDASLASSGLALITGSIFLIRGRRKH
jgi:hypothetical protein